MVNSLLGMQNLPYVSLIKGNLTDLDKAELVSNIVSKYVLAEVDVLRIFSLTTDSSKEIKEFASTQPVGELKLIVIDLDKSSTQSQNSLLALLENPPRKIKFLLFSSSATLTTVESRSEIFCASSTLIIDKQAKSTVLTVLRATQQLEVTKLEEAMRAWDDKCHKLLLEWAVESKLRKPKIFTTEELSLGSFPQGFEDNLILALSILDSARPRISAKSILLGYIEKSK